MSDQGREPRVFASSAELQKAVEPGELALVKSSSGLYYPWHRGRYADRATAVSDWREVPPGRDPVQVALLARKYLKHMGGLGTEDRGAKMLEEARGRAKRLLERQRSTRHGRAERRRGR